MDNVSHTLVGAAMGEAGLKKYSGLGMATLMIAANLPDLDVLAIPFGHNLTFRRGWTHGPLAILVLPIALTAVMVGFDRLQMRWGKRPSSRAPVRPVPLFMLSLAGFLTHPFLDWLNNYGIRLLMPFSHEWYYGDALFIVDPWLWLMMGVGIYASRRRRSRSAARAGRPAGIALALLTLYITSMIGGSRYAQDIAVREVEAQFSQTADRLMAGPVPINPLRRQLIADLGDAYATGAFVWTPGPGVEFDLDRLPKNADHPAVHAAQTRPEISDFLYWSRFPFYVVTHDSAGYRIVVSDVRFGRGEGWASASVIVPSSDVMPRPAGR